MFIKKCPFIITQPKKQFLFFTTKNPRIAENFTKTIAHSLLPPTLRLVTSTKLNFEAGLLGPRRDKKERGTERERVGKRDKAKERETRNTWANVCYKVCESGRM